MTAWPGLPWVSDSKSNGRQENNVISEEAAPCWYSLKRWISEKLKSSLGSSWHYIRNSVISQKFGNWRDRFYGGGGLTTKFHNDNYCFFYTSLTFHLGPSIKEVRKFSVFWTPCSMSAHFHTYLRAPYFWLITIVLFIIRCIL